MYSKGPLFLLSMSSLQSEKLIMLAVVAIFFRGGGQTNKKRSQGVLLPYTITLFVYLRFVS